ncbi:cilia- and flagella-associated protein HOATZ-like [Haliotis rufescens]|uniref:cilia- and flagella-associated protein HOATZ-like n=1 Tax=Haliotis rufescens TaxID=6454 RepID=UPI00201F1469|nr:cilia- and flagella-associated protein HOATZ-like [Haliotis rufescens]
MTTNMALKLVDCTKGEDRVTFSDSLPEDIAYAKTFWQSLQLLPPMESRLVSSDIKQRLKKAPSAYQGVSRGHRAHMQPIVVQDFLSRARTMETMEEYERLRRLASARDEDRETLSRRRTERMKKEEISRNHVSSQSRRREQTVFKMSDDEEQEEDVGKLMQDLDDFDKSKGHASDSD